MKRLIHIVFTLGSICIASAYEPSDSSFENKWQWAVANDGNNKDIDTVEAWDHTKGSPSIVVAVIDTGVDWTHEDLVHCIWTNESEALGIPFWDDDLNGVVDDVHGAWFLAGAAAALPVDEVGHGTPVAGIIAAAMDNETTTDANIVGVAPNVKIMPIKVNIPFLEQVLPIANAIIYAVNNGADVINVSLGSSGISGDVNAAIISPAINYAESHNVVIVASSGNSEGEPTCYPARFPTVIGVGAHDRSGIRCDNDAWGDLTDPFEFGIVLAHHGSSYGEGLDVVAPGHYILSTLPSNSYGPQYGTSFAAPHVAGVCALVKSVSPGMAAAQVRETICRTSEYIGDPNGDGVTNLDEVASTDNVYGIPWNKYTGYGRVNAFSAVCRAKFPSRPTVQSVTFPGGVNDDVTVYFSEPMWSNSLSSGNITLTGSSSGGHACTYSLDSTATTLTISSASAFVPGEALTLALSAGVLDAGKQSLLTSFSDVLQVGSTPPTAAIQSITPSSITQGDGDVTFDGSASGATMPGATVATYRWNSSLAGQLYSGANPSFSHDSSLLSAGQHTISLQVRDSNGQWSQNNDQGTLSVYEPGPDEGHDLAFEHMDLDSMVIPTNGTVRVDLFVQNQGSFTETGFDIRYRLRKSDGTVMDEEVKTATPSWSPGQTRGPGYVYLTASGGYQGQATVEVTIENALDEDRSDNAANSGLYVGPPPEYDGYYGGSWTLILGTGNPVEGSYTLTIQTYHGGAGAPVTYRITKGGTSWDQYAAAGQIHFFDANKLAVIYAGGTSSGGPRKDFFSLLINNTGQAWLTDKIVTTIETEPGEFTIHRSDPDSTYCSDWNVSFDGQGATVRNWNPQDERIDNYLRRFTITPPLDAAGYYQFWLLNCDSYSVSATTTERNGNTLAIRAAVSVQPDNNPDTAVVSGPSGTVASRNVTFTYSGSDDRTSVGNLTYSYRLLGYQESWSGYSGDTFKSYTDLSNGTYTFEVKAKDNVGQTDPTPAQREFTVDVQNPPATPVNVAPNHLVSLRGASGIGLEGGAFSDPDPGATHAASEFLVRSNAGDYSSPAWNSGTPDPVTATTIPAGDLSHGDYWWKCRYRDNTDRWSQWSGETAFTVLDNHAPSAEDHDVSVVHDQSAGIELPSADPDGDPVGCSMLSDPTNGGSVITNGPLHISYTPPASFVGTDSFTYQVSDGLLGSSVATVTVEVVNHAPYANTVLVVVESGERITLSLPGGDADGDDLTYTIEDIPDNGTLFTADLANGNVDYQSTPGFNADDALTYSLGDGIATDTGTVSIVVSDPNNMTIDLVEDALGQLAVKYPAIVGYTYRVQYCNNLLDEWQDLASGTVGDGTVWLKADTTAEMPRSRMYRIIVETP